MSRLAYPGSPDHLNGAEDTSHIKEGQTVADNGYRHFIKHGSLLDPGAASKSASGTASTSNPTAGKTGTHTDGPKQGLSVKKQLLLLPLVIAVIVVVAIGYVAAKDALFGDKSEDSAAPAQPAAEAPADSGASDGDTAGETGGDTAGDAQSGLTSADQAPEPIADFVEVCTDYEVMFSYYGADNSPAPEAKGINCSVDTTKAPEVGYVVFTDDPAATAAVRDGKPVLKAAEISAESTRGSTFKAQRLEAMFTVQEILPDDKGIVEYMIKSDDPEVAKKALVDLGVAK
ncbi:hypothetical protein [Corynebacterium aurimucosum]|uniref:Putative membrane protein n=1 Tax=Corynebacterium aurimucosum (strain ATCC 700975 / DSM 44827 / CIP 107346 / CN-1) TaxID=548476 RepID=C3PJD2_CORA7|nr:hypothetical protein [Corynebacterium aurimucosum]ACP33818.1 putative membrane protein [Corynebacterium aurimucosum ATCC 700975]QQU92089.1 hypothetical protein I6I67_07385 [Corynebacterium aurimucosum]